MIVKQKNKNFKFDILTYRFRQFNLSATLYTYMLRQAQQDPTTDFIPA